MTLEEIREIRDRANELLSAWLDEWEIAEPVPRVRLIQVRAVLEAAGGDAAAALRLELSAALAERDAARQQKKHLANRLWDAADRIDKLKAELAESRRGALERARGEDLEAEAEALTPRPAVDKAVEKKSRAKKPGASLEDKLRTLCAHLEVHPGQTFDRKALLALLPVKGLSQGAKTQLFRRLQERLGERLEVAGAGVFRSPFSYTYRPPEVGETRRAAVQGKALLLEKHGVPRHFAERNSYHIPPPKPQDPAEALALRRFADRYDGLAPTDFPPEHGAWEEWERALERAREEVAS